MSRPSTVTVRVVTAGADPVDHEVDIPSNGLVISEVLKIAGINGENKSISREVKPGAQARAGDVLYLTDKVKPGATFKVAERPQGS